MQQFYSNKLETHLVVRRQQLSQEEVQQRFSGLLPNRGGRSSYHVFVSYRFG